MDGFSVFYLENLPSSAGLNCGVVVTSHQEAPGVLLVLLSQNHVFGPSSPKPKALHAGDSLQFNSQFFTEFHLFVLLT